MKRVSRGIGVRYPADRSARATRHRRPELRRARDRARGHGGFRDFRLLQEEFFDLARIDIEAAGNDQIAAAPQSV